MKVQIDTSKLHSLKDALQKRIVKKAVRAGTKQVVKDVRSHARVASGALKKSISSKVDSVKGGTLVYAVIGPRSKYTKQAGKTLKRPGRYSWLVEFGKYKRPFLQPAWAAGRREYLDTVQTVIAKELQAEIGR